MGLGGARYRAEPRSLGSAQFPFGSEEPVSAPCIEARLTFPALRFEMQEQRLVAIVDKCIAVVHLADATGLVQLRPAPGIGFMPFRTSGEEDVIRRLAAASYLPMDGAGSDHPGATCEGALCDAQSSIEGDNTH